MVTERDIKGIFEGLPYRLDLEPRSPTMDKKLMITVATTGGFLKKEQNPYQPYLPDEVASQAIDAYEAGASVWHVHVRDKDGYLVHKNPRPIIEAIDMIKARCPDMLMSQSRFVDPTKPGADGIKPLVEPLLAAGAESGRSYIDTMVIIPAQTGITRVNEPIIVEIVQYLQSQGIKPEFQLFNYLCIDHVIRWLIQPGILHKPHIMNVLSGAHGHYFVGPTIPEAWGHIYLMTMMQQVPQGSVVGATIGGRNWLPLTVMAIMLGADCVRIGMEDAMWMYPHKDEMIAKSADTIKKIVAIARELGREIATPAEARKILGLD